MDRPGLRKALVAAKAARYDLLLVYRLDRFTRRIRDLAVLKARLPASHHPPYSGLAGPVEAHRRIGATITIVTEGDTSSPAPSTRYG